MQLLSFSCCLELLNWLLLVFLQYILCLNMSFIHFLKKLIANIAVIINFVQLNASGMHAHVKGIIPGNLGIKIQ